MAFLNKIFSIKKDGYTKHITILGIKIKRTNRIKKLEEEIKNLKYKLYRYCPDEKRAEAMKDWYFDKTGEILDLKNPKTFNQKIQWLKLYDSTPIKTRLADKYLVREWVKEKIGEDFLIPLLGVYEKFEDIDFDDLPERFVLKTNHGAGYNYIVKDKSKLNKKLLKSIFDKWMNTNYAYVNGLELQYKDIKPLILIEKYLENENEELNDYKFYCFDGKVQYIQYISERSNGYKMKFFDRDWNPQNFVSNHSMLKIFPKKLDNLQSIINVVEKLAQGFMFVRVDLYVLDNGDVKFGEMTFTPASGTLNWQPENMDMVMGSFLKIDFNREVNI